VTRRQIIIAASTVVGVILIAWMVIARIPRDRQPAATGTAAAQPGGTVAAAERKITATLFYITEDGMSLKPIQRDVPFGEPVTEQARRIIEAQIGAAPAPLASAIPEGTRLRALFISERGDAFVDLSGEVTSKHTGGALDELFTVYAIINSLTVNLPAITRVQILIDGKEADTLAGHVDLRQPLSKNMKWIQTDNPS
jgi:spore germination protein GerM